MTKPTQLTELTIRHVLSVVSVLSGLVIAGQAGCEPSLHPFQRAKMRTEPPSDFRNSLMQHDLASAAR
jgi:hypothetical protein